MLSIFKSRLAEIQAGLHELDGKLSAYPADVLSSPYVDRFLSDNIKKFSLENRSLVYTDIPEIQHANRDDAKDFLQRFYAELEKRILRSDDRDDVILALGRNVLQNECVHALELIAR